MGEAKLSLVQKLSKIRKIADAVRKDKKGYNYMYADIEAILAKVRAGMEKYGVSLIPSIVNDSRSVEKIVTVNTKTDKTGKTYDSTATEMLVYADMEFVWVNDEDPDDRITVPWFVVGMQGDPSQAFGSGLTYCSRYFLANYFQIVQSDDVDAYRSKQKDAEASEGKAIAEEIISRFDTMVKAFLADNQDKQDDVKKLIGKYVKSFNYFNIKEPMLAAKLLEDFKTTFLKEEK